MWNLILVLVALTNATTVYFVPHSHIDVGWIDVTSYYYTEHGSKIMNTMLTLLEEKQDRKFCWSEAFFFASWLKDHPDYTARLRKLVENGQLEIAGGGWVMNDEALTDFEGVARQVEAGHSFLRENLGVGPIKVAWQLDPFGHSSVTPAIFEKLGFEYMVMSRVDGAYRVIPK
jgi:alpha-mannosidase